MTITGLSVGDLVVFHAQPTVMNQAYILWVGPDYDSSSMDVLDIIDGKTPVILIKIAENDNALVLTLDGCVGWTRTSLLKKL